MCLNTGFGAGTDPMYKTCVEVAHDQKSKKVSSGTIDVSKYRFWCWQVQWLQCGVSVRDGKDMTDISEKMPIPM